MTRRSGRASDLLVGLVVILGTLAILGATLWVNQSDLGHRRIGVRARFRDVGSVRVGSAVVIRGVPSGRVQMLELAPDDWVEMRMKLDPDVRLPRDPVALLNESSLFGEWQVTITERAAVPEDREVRRQVQEASGDPDVMPGATLPDIAKLTTVAGRIAGDVASVANRVEVAFDDRAARELRASIANFSTLSGELSRTVSTQSRNLDSIAVDVHAGVETLRETAGAFQRIAHRVDSSTASGQVHEIVRDVASASRQLDETAAQLRAIAGSVGRSQQTLETIMARSDTLLARINASQGTLGLLINDPGLYQHLDSLATATHALVADVKANPKRYVRLKIF